MVKITGPILELETVRRFRDILKKGHDEYDVTLSYALFNAILCWVVERGRTRSDILGGQHDAGRKFFEKLTRSPIQMLPWRVRYNKDYKLTLSEASELEKKDIKWRTIGVLCMADQFFVALRNGMSHGDGKQVFPYNAHGKLIGYYLLCEIMEQGKHKGRKTIWKGVVFLRRDDIVKLGCQVADDFIEQMELAKVDSEGNGHGVEELKRNAAKERTA